MPYPHIFLGLPSAPKMVPQLFSWPVPFNSTWNINLYLLSSVQWLSRVQLFVTPCITACQASLSITNSGIHPNSHPSSRWCHPAISSSVIPFYSCPQSFPVSEFQLQHQSLQWTPRTDLLWIDLLDLLAVQGTLKSLLQHHSSKAPILQCSVFFTVQLSHSYMTTRKNHSLD